MPVGLSVDDVVRVTINLTPLAAPSRNFGALAVIGASDVIDTGERLRQYSTLDGVAADFGTTAPEFLAADLFFSQNPQPALLYIGRWAQTASQAQLNGAQFSPAQQTDLLATLQAITTGGMTITIDGVLKTLSNMNFSGITNLNGAASILDAAIAGGGVVWNSNFGRFEVQSDTTGPTSTITYATNPGSGALLATDLGLTQAIGASAPVSGIAAEEPVQAVTAIAPLNADVYGIMFATATPPSTNQYLALAAYIEGASPTHILGINVSSAAAIDPTSTTDLGYLLHAANYTRTFWQYSTSSPYAVASMFARAFTVDFTANNTVITLKFKQEPGVTAETLNETQAQALKDKKGNVFVRYMNDTAIIQEGTMASGIFFDERHSTDWLSNQVQTDVYNLFYTSPTKIPQTDPGVHQVVTTVENSLARGVFNGMIAPGIWTSSLEFGVLKQGQALAKGYYVYAAPLAIQAQGDRELRKAPPIQCAIKLAGAIHSANVAINVNR